MTARSHTKSRRNAKRRRRLALIRRKVTRCQK